MRAAAAEEDLRGGEAGQAQAPDRDDAMLRSLLAPDATDGAKKTRADLAATYRMLDRLGLNEGVCNHLTALLPGTRDRFLVIRYGLLWSEVTPENLVLIDATGRILEGEGPIEVTAFEIHRAIHLADPDNYVCVLHTHMPYATALCCVSEVNGDWGLKMCHQNSCRFYGEVSNDECFNGLVTDSTEGDRLAAAMQGKRVLLHRSHGVMVCGRTVAAAFDDLYYLERAAQVQVLAMSTHRPLVLVDDAVARGTKAAFEAEKLSAAELHLDAWKRELAREDARARLPATASSHVASVVAALTAPARAALVLLRHVAATCLGVRGSDDDKKPGAFLQALYNPYGAPAPWAIGGGEAHRKRL